MPQENAFHNLLFLLGKREKERGRKKRTGTQQTREGERGEEELTSDTRRAPWVRLVRSNLLTGGWGGVTGRHTEGENGPLM